MSEIIRLGFLIYSLSRGGAERVLLNLAQAYKSKGYYVVLITMHKAEKEYADSTIIPRMILDQETIEGNSHKISWIKRIRKICIKKS